MNVEIRSENPMYFRSKLWAKVRGVVLTDRGLCYDVLWDDGGGDYWPVYDQSGHYSFRTVQS